MDPYFSHNKEQHNPYANFPFYPYPFPMQSPWPCHLNPNQLNNYNCAPGYYPFRPPYYEFPNPNCNFPNYYPPYLSPTPNCQFNNNNTQFNPLNLNPHCCGCPNHICHQKENPNLKVEEKKSNFEENNPSNPFFWFYPKNGDQTEKAQNEKEKLSWPIIWMPEDEIKESKDQNANKVILDQNAKSKPNFKIIPLKFIENGNNEERESGERVKKGSKNEERESSDEKRKIVERENNEKMKKKNEKLPPVCLRVDPIHKRSTNRSEDLNAKSKEKRDNSVNVQDKKLTEEKSKKQIKVIDVKIGNEGEDLNAELKEMKADSVNVQTLNNNGNTINKKRKMSEIEAAILIQKIYRGYNVRRWDPLDNLKNIRCVYEKLRDLRDKLQNDHLEKKEKLVLGETIMNLLLQLDTIQGLHPNVREARKSVARELVFLQEKLDSLVEAQNPAFKESGKQESGFGTLDEPKKQESEKQEAEKKEIEEQESEEGETEIRASEKKETRKQESRKEETGKENTEKEETRKEETEKDETGKEETEKEEIRKGETEIRASEREVIEKQETGNQETGKEELEKEETRKGESEKETEKEEIGKEKTVKEESEKGEIGKGETEIGPSGKEVTLNQESEKEETEKEHIEKEETRKEELEKEETWKEESKKETMKGEIEKEEIWKENTAKEETEKEEIRKEESEDEEVKKEEIEKQESDFGPAQVDEEPVKGDSEKQESEKQESYPGTGQTYKELVKQESGKQEPEKQESEKQESEKQESDSEIRKIYEEPEKHEWNIVDANDFLETENPNEHGNGERTKTDITHNMNAEKRLVEENEKLRESLEKLLEAGRGQLGLIEELNERVKDLEKKLAKKKRKNMVRVKMHNKS